MLFFFIIFNQNIDCEYTLEPPLCFEAKVRQIGISLQTTGLLNKSGV